MFKVLSVVDKNAAEKAALIDEYGELDRKKQLRDNSREEQRLKVLEATIKDWHVNDPPGEPAEDHGNLYVVSLSARENERKLSVEAQKKIFRELRKAKIDPFTRFDVTLSAVESDLGKTVLEQLATKDRTGSRKLKVIAKAPPTPARIAA